MMSAPAQSDNAPVNSPVAGDRAPRARQAFGWLALITLIIATLSLGSGAAGLPLGQILSDLLSGAGLSARDQLILVDIRLPRLAMGLLIGAALAVSGVLMQGLFRNPLADPGIVGVGAGAGLGAVSAIVLGSYLPVALAAAVGQWLVPVAAFLGSWTVTLILYRLGTSGGQTSVATLLLAGIAIGALGSAITGILIYKADDAQLRSLTFWGMGSLAGANWSKVMVGLPLILPVLLLAPLLARGMNTLALGEAPARHLGTDVQKIKRLSILAVAAAVGVAVALAGGIGFIGIVVPHLLRMAIGPDHRYLLPNAALLGGALLICADMVARVVVAPSELPIGIITALIGAPVFLWILLQRRGLAGF
jgi:iron complex transport system permease protein